MDIDGPAVVFVWVAMILFFLIHALISSVIISGISHVYSMVSKKKHFAFMKVFPCVTIVLLILVAIYFIVVVIVNIR